MRVTGVSGADKERDLRSVFRCIGVVLLREDSSSLRFDRAINRSVSRVELLLSEEGSGFRLGVEICRSTTSDAFNETGDTGADKESDLGSVGVLLRDDVLTELICPGEGGGFRVGGERSRFKTGGDMVVSMADVVSLLLF